jgi:hypothetical protein
MIKPTRKGVWESPGALRAPPPRRVHRAALLRLGLAALPVILGWISGLIAGDAPPNPTLRPAFVRSNRSTQVGRGLTDDAPEATPISRVVPRVKTIPPGFDKAHDLPPGFDTAEVWPAGTRALPDTELEPDIDGDDLPSTVRDLAPSRMRELPRPAAAAQRTKLAAQADAPLARTSPPEIIPDPGIGPPLGGEAIVDTDDDPQFLPEPTTPDGFGFVVDEPWPQDPGGYDSTSCPPQGVNDCHCWGPLKKFQYFNRTNGDIGIGHERVMFAPFEIETSQPANNIRLRMMSAFNLHTPDRAEYLWAKIGGAGPPLPEQRVNYQNYDAIYEAGGKRFSLVTDIPLRSMDPENNLVGAGIGNISLAPKVVIVDGNDWQITQIFRTYLPTGATQRGTSNGLTSLEPGLLVRYRWSPRTFVHGQVKYWIPLTGDPIASGNVFSYGLGASHVLHETDSFAIIPVLEAVGWTVGGGTATLPSGLATSADTSFVNIQPGVRFVLGPKGDLGLCEFGISSGFATNVTGWYQEQFTIELRWSW